MALPDGWTHAPAHPRRRAGDPRRWCTPATSPPSASPDFSADEVEAALDLAARRPGARLLAGATTPDGGLGGWAYLDNDERWRPRVRRGLRAARARCAGPAPAARPAAGAGSPSGPPSAGSTEVTARAGALPTEIAVDRRRSQAAGFTFVKRTPACAARSTASRRAPLPAGVTIRPVRPDDDDDLRRFHADLRHRRSATPTTTSRATTTRGGRYVAGLTSVAWDEWFVAEVDGGRRACCSRPTRRSRTTRAGSRTSRCCASTASAGSAAALLRHAFAVYAAKGRTQAGLGVDLANPTEAARALPRGRDDRDLRGQHLRAATPRLGRSTADQGLDLAAMRRSWSGGRAARRRSRRARRPSRPRWRSRRDTTRSAGRPRSR